MESTNTSNPAKEAAREATGQAANLASAAADQTTEVASTAVESGKWVAAVGSEQAMNVASAASEQVAQVANEVGTQARNLIDESKDQLRSQARSQTEQIAAKLRELGDQVHALADGRATDAGPVGDYARQAAQTVAQFADRFEQRGLEGVVGDVQRFARQRPGAFLLGAAVAGFGVGRILRAGAATPSTQQPVDSGQSPYAPYEALGLSTQPPPLVDVTDGSVAGLTASEDPTLPGVPAGSAAGVSAGSPASTPTDPGRIA